MPTVTGAPPTAGIHPVAPSPVWWWRRLWWDPGTRTDVAVVAQSPDGSTRSLFPLPTILGPVSAYPQEVVATENGAFALLLMQPPVGPSRPVMAIGTTASADSQR